jgi:hypothetical protein
MKIIDWKINPKVKLYPKEFSKKMEMEKEKN